MYQIRCPLREAGTVGKNQVGLICPEGRLTFYEYDQAVTATAQQLQALGVARGDRLGLAASRGWEQSILFFAALRAGAVACFSDHHVPDEGLGADLDAIACRHAVLDDAPSRTKHTGIHYMRAADVVRMMLPQTENNLDFAFEGNRPATITFTGLRSTRRAVLHSYSSLYYGALDSNVSVDLRTNDRWLVSAPMHEMDALTAVFRCVVSGATLVLSAQEASVAENVLASSATHANLSAQDLEALVGSGRMNDCRLKVAIVREPLSDALWQEVRRAGIRVQMCYTIPEVASEVTAMTKLSPPSKQHTVGVAMRYGGVRIADDGRIQVRGRALCDGYVQGEKVVPVADAQGWFTANDYGSLDSDGYLTLLKRA